MDKIAEGSLCKLNDINTIIDTINNMSGGSVLPNKGYAIECIPYNDIHYGTMFPDIGMVIGHFTIEDTNSTYTVNINGNPVWNCKGQPIGSKVPFTILVGKEDKITTRPVAATNVWYLHFIENDGQHSGGTVN